LFDYYPEGSKEKIDRNLVLGSSKHVEFVGLEDVVLVETKDAILVLNRSNAQDVKKVYERLEKENPGLLN
jgi:mannose-1-phosphate guanylyltransferase